MGQLTYGQDVTVIGYEGGWCKIQYGDKTGYIYGNYVSITPAEAAAAETVAEETSSASAGQNVVEYAKNFIGVPYVYGGSSPYGFDCSGFVQYVYKYFGISLPRTSYSQMQSGYAVSTSDLQPGDILVFRGGGHVGIYVGNNTYIHAPNSGRSVSIDPLDRTVTAARRIF
ncbi:MAG: C40 family peptidase [Clostridia bacterium]|nr:C40 family peptidase [Clostridia bacterium]